MENFNKNPIIPLILAFFLLLGFGRPIPAYAVAIAPDLGVAESFSVLAFPSMTAANPTTLSGDLGLSSGLAGSKTGTWNVGGSEYFGPLSLAATARTDALDAFNDLAAQATSGVWSLNASPLPGVWTTAGSATFPGPTLTLSGDYDDVWVFQIGADFTFTGAVVMAGNAQACNVFWQVDNDATIASGSAFQGTLIAGNDVTVVSGATVNGRILSLDGALTTDNNTISGPTCEVAPPPPPPPPPPSPGMAQLTLIKTVTNDNLGTAVPAAWLLAAVGPTPISGATGSVAVTNASVGLGAYTLSESGGPAGYTGSIYSCEIDGGPAVVNNLITLADGESAICTINNNDIAPSGGSSTVGGSLGGGVGSGGSSSSGSIGGSVGSSGSSGGSSSSGSSGGSSGSGGGAVLGASIEPTVTASDFTIPPVPGLPKTGSSSEEKNALWSLIVSTGIFVVLASRYLARRKPID